MTPSGTLGGYWRALCTSLFSFFSFWFSRGNHRELHVTLIYMRCGIIATAFSHEKPVALEYPQWVWCLKRGKGAIKPLAKMIYVPSHVLLHNSLLGGKSTRIRNSINLVVWLIDLKIRGTSVVAYNMWANAWLICSSTSSPSPPIRIYLTAQMWFTGCKCREVGFAHSDS